MKLHAFIGNPDFTKPNRSYQLFFLNGRPIRSRLIAAALDEALRAVIPRERHAVAFIFIEMAFIQKFILFLAHPIYAVSVILAGFLVLAGAGSAAAGGIRRLSRRPQKTARAACMSAAVVALAYAFFLGGLLRPLMGSADWARIATTLVLLAPLAPAMGVPFPSALRRLGRSHPGLVPWAWGVNGCASVIGAPLATILAVAFGFRAVVAGGAALYLAAALLYPHLPPAEGKGKRTDPFFR